MGSIAILLADDDKDDRLFFQEALEEIAQPTTLKTVDDGEQLMHHLVTETDQFPTVLFLDLNMPRKNGFVCLEEIKRSEKLKSLPVIIFSTSFDEKVAEQLYENGAHHYICKPADFSQLKKVLQHALQLISQEKKMQPPKEKFLLSNLVSILI